MELDETRPKWRQVYAVILERIADGTYPPNSRIPSVLALSEEFGMSTVTGQKVIRALRADGSVRTEVGMGSYVNETPAAEE